MKSLDIYLDLDGVLVDLVAGLIHGHNLNMTHEDVTKWEISDIAGIPYDDFWGCFGKEFWANLPRTPEFDKYINMLDKWNPIICTSPTKFEGCTEGKIKWIEWNLPRYWARGRFIITPKKHLIAQPDTLLIDDYDQNCVEWERAGGVSILVPRPWNGMKHFSGCSFDWVERSFNSQILFLLHNSYNN